MTTRENKKGRSGRTEGAEGAQRPAQGSSWKDKDQNEGKRLPVAEKVFQARCSLLTEMLEVSHIRTLYHICIVILIILILNTVAFDLLNTGSLNLGLKLVILGFGKSGTVCCIWAAMQGTALAVLGAPWVWARARRAGLGVPRAWDALALVLLLCVQVALLTLPVWAVVYYHLPIASAVIVLTEMLRFTMKIHAAVRSVVPRVLRGGPQALPPYRCYLYFMFAPTLIYRDEYPRSGQRSWRAVALRLLEVAVIIMYMSFLCERFLLRFFEDFGKPGKVVAAEELVLTVFGTMLPALLLFTCGFYLLLHSWMNAAAEALRFADRRFYLDWWNQSNYGAYYRTFNTVVHDWLYCYIYRDVLLLGGSRLRAQLLVFLVSAIFHEVVLGFAFGFFYPVMLIFFGFFGVALVFLTRRAGASVGNVVMWLTLAIGNGLMWSLYSMEFFALRNCPLPEDASTLQHLLPRSWLCHGIRLRPDWHFQNPLHR